MGKLDSLEQITAAILVGGQGTRLRPVVGDRQYGRKSADPLPAEAPRQMLHAARLAFRHPRTGAALTFEAPIPPDMQTLLDALRRSVEGAGRSGSASSQPTRSRREMVTARGARSIGAPCRAAW